MNDNRKAVAIYARVSTDRQAVDMQLHELREYVARRGWTIQEEYIDHGYSGSSTKRPAFTLMMNEAKKRKFDILLVWKLDRLSRSMKDLITTLHELGALGIDFVSYDNGLDTSTPTGKLVFHVIGAVAEFERDIIRERVKAGLENARRKGKTLGRPQIPTATFDQAKELRSQGISFRKIANKLDIHESTIRFRFKKNQVESKQ
jgi:DNA invertase Pin-like site-specific DNA recombinase